MAIFASTSTITTQTVPLIVVDPATIDDRYLLRWDASVGAFTAQELEFPDYYTIDLTSDNIVGVLPLEKGGTGLETYNPGDILYANNDGSLAALSIEVGDNEKVLTSLNGLPVWQDTTALKNVVISKISTLGTTTSTIGDLIPENSQLKTISIHIDVSYDTSDITISDSTETLIDSNEIISNREGIYIYSLDKFYQVEDQLTLNIAGATVGSMRIFVEYINI